MEGDGDGRSIVDLPRNPPLLSLDQDLGDPYGGGLIPVEVRLTAFNGVYEERDGGLLLSPCGFWGSSPQWCLPSLQYVRS